MQNPAVVDGTKTENIMFRLPADLIEWLTERSNETFRSRNQLVRMLIKQERAAVKAGKQTEQA